MPSSIEPLGIGDDGWLTTAASRAIERVPSPNFDERPAGDAPTLIVVHNISLPPGEFGGRAIDALFTNALDFGAHPYFAMLEALRVSAHILVRRTGEIVQFVPFHARAWHAGISMFRGRERCNDFSIGIELEGDDRTAFDDAQYEALVALVDVLAERYPIDAIAGHSDIAPGRKTDPGPCFEWSRLHEAGDLRQRTLSMPAPWVGGGCA